MGRLSQQFALLNIAVDPLPLMLVPCRQNNWLGTRRSTAKENMSQHSAIRDILD
jgi:hypothetical protein